ncbi:MAG: methyltransferase domain-containing protein, partial [Acidobacteriia bacterium]|nr:methyltransferase domain-containing protein [Terriglobia bacterium]
MKGEAGLCLLCGSGEFVPAFYSSDRLYGTTDRQFAVVRCGGCGLMRLEPRPSENELRDYYPAAYWFAPNGQAAGRFEQAYRRLVLRDHVRFVEGALDRARASGNGERWQVPLLDVGCGGGLFLRLMRERGFRAVGLDFSADAARMAWRLEGAPVVCGTLDHAPLNAAT